LNLLVKEGKAKKNFKEFVVGDSSGVVTLSLTGDEIDVALVDATVELRNAGVRMQNGHICLFVGKWGNICKYEGSEETTPLLTNDVSAQEYELVVS